MASSLGDISNVRRRTIRQRVERRSRVAVGHRVATRPLTAASPMPGLKVGKTTEASFALDALSRRRLVFGWPVKTSTMMHACASGAKLRGGGSILGSAQAPCIPSDHRRLGCRWQTSKTTKQSTGLRLRELQHDQTLAGRNLMSSVISPVVASRHSAMSSLRASATIMVLRVLRRPSAVRSRNQRTSLDSF